MANLAFCPKCCAFIPAVPCEEQPIEGTPPPLVVPYSLYSPLVAIKYFSYAGYCYSVDSSDTPRKRNKGEHKLTSFGKNYEDCSECEEDLEPAPGGGEPVPPTPCCDLGDVCCVERHPVTGVCMHIVYIYDIEWIRANRPHCIGGGVPTEPPDDEDPKGFQATLCPGQLNTPNAPDVWVYEGLDDGSYIFRYGGWCYEVEISGEGTVIPDGAIVVPPLSNYDTCEECIGGIPAVFCSLQRLPPGTRWPWIHAYDRPDEVTTVRIDGLCWQFSPTAPSSPIPQGARIVTVDNQFANCATCVQGIVAELCKIEVTDPVTGIEYEQDQVNIHKAPVVWIPATYLEEFSVFKYKGWCYSADPEGELVVRPANAETLFVKDQYFGECQNCVCADPQSVNGIKAVVCSGQADAYKAQDIWVAEEDLPPELAYFVVAELCYSIDPDGEIKRMPSGAVLYAPNGEFENCTDCISSRVEPPPGGGGPPGPGDPPPDGCPPVGFPPPECPDPPDPPPPDPDPTEPPPGGVFPPPNADTLSYRLYTCSGDTVSPTDDYVSAVDESGEFNGLAGRYTVIDEVCYWVSNVQSTSGAPIYNGPVYAQCQQCAETLCDCNALATVTSRIDDDDAVWFGTFEAGTYTVQYVKGAVNYGNGLRVNDYHQSEHGYKVVGGGVDGSTVTDLANAPGIAANNLDSQYEVEELSHCMSVVVNHPGGLIGIRLFDSPYHDNSLDENDPAPSPPIFKLCAGGVGECPTDNDDCDELITATFDLPPGSTCQTIQILAPQGDGTWQNTGGDAESLFISCVGSVWRLEYFSSEPESECDCDAVFEMPRTGPCPTGVWTTVSAIDCEGIELVTS